MKAGAFRLFSLCSVALLLSSCFALDPDNVMAAWAETGGNSARVKRIASWYAQATEGGYIFCRADLSYDSEGRLAREEKRSYNIRTQEVTLTVIHEFEYNAQGRIARITRSVPKYGSSATSNHSFEYGEDGLLVTSSRVSSDPYIIRNYTYTHEGGRLTRIETTGEINTLSWNQGRLSRYSGATKTYSYGYGTQGKCNSFTVNSPGVHSSYAYDDDGLMLYRRFYDEVQHAYTQHFVWEWGTTSYDISDVAFCLTYLFGLFHTYGLP